MELVFNLVITLFIVFVSINNGLTFSPIPTIIPNSNYPQNSTMSYPLPRNMESSSSSSTSSPSSTTAISSDYGTQNGLNGSITPATGNRLQKTSEERGYHDATMTQTPTTAFFWDLVPWTTQRPKAHLSTPESELITTPGKDWSVASTIKQGYLVETTIPTGHPKRQPKSIGDNTLSTVTPTSKPTSELPTSVKGETDSNNETVDPDAHLDDLEQDGLDSQAIDPKVWNEIFKYNAEHEDNVDRFKNRTLPRLIAIVILGGSVLLALVLGLVHCRSSKLSSSRHYSIQLDTRYA